MPREPDTRRRFTRRGAMAAVTGVAAAAAGAGRARAQATIQRKFVVPAVEQFEDKYVGNLVLVTGEPRPPGEVPAAVAACDFAAWPPADVVEYEGLFLDRLAETRVQAVEIPVYADGTATAIRPGQPFVIGSATACPAEWLGIDAESVPTERLDGEPIGPTVTPTSPTPEDRDRAGDPDGPSPGEPAGSGSSVGGPATAALAGVSGLGLLRLAGRLRR